MEKLNSKRLSFNTIVTISNEFKEKFNTYNNRTINDLVKSLSDVCKQELSAVSVRRLAKLHGIKIRLNRNIKNQTDSSVRRTAICYLIDVVSDIVSELGMKEQAEKMNKLIELRKIIMG